MTNLNPSDDDKNLVDFLRKNQPSPPLNSNKVERELMALIHKNAREAQPTRKRWVLIFPSLITLGMILIWSSNQGSLGNSQASIDEDAIETFLVNNWQEALAESNTKSLPQPGESYLLLHSSEKSQFLSVSP